MPRKQLQNMQLPESGYNPVVFQGYTTEGPEYDTNILANSIGRLDTAIKEASDKQGAVNLALGEIRSQLNPEEYEWFDRYTRENYINPIQAEINAGNYGSAITLGTRLGTEAAKDFEFQDRARVNKQYQEERELQRKRVNNGISQATFDWWDEQNRYNYTPKIVNGVNVGGEDWKSKFTPENDLNPAEEALTAFKLLTPKKYSGSSKSNIDSKNSYTDLTKVDASSYERITQKDILKNINNIIGPNVSKWRALRQGFNVTLRELEKYKKEYEQLDPNSEEYALKKQQYEDQMSYFKGENDQPLANDENGWKIYYSRLVTDNMLAQGLAYDWRTTENARIKDDPNSINKRGKSDPDYYNPNELEDKEESSPGNKVKVSTDTQSATKTARSAGSKAGAQFDKPKK